ncbi:MAG: rod shape-determining protein MreD [Pseudomonadota bacterium]|nr:rod shape-determining protein MreD [Pseudomonadota bacterium]
MIGSARFRLALAPLVMLPALTCLALLLVGVAYLSMPSLAPIMPPLALIAIYYWTVHTPLLVPLVFVFALGLVYDCLTGTPPGMTALLFLICRQGILSQRLILVNQTFVVLWFGFFTVALAMSVMQWAFTSLFILHFTPPHPFLFQVFLGTGLFPPFAFLLLMVHRLVPRFD